MKKNGQGYENTDLLTEIVCHCQGKCPYSFTLLLTGKLSDHLAVSFLCLHPKCHASVTVKDPERRKALDQAMRSGVGIACRCQNGCGYSFHAFGSTDELPDQLVIAFSCPSCGTISKASYDTTPKE